MTRFFPAVFRWPFVVSVKDPSPGGRSLLYASERDGSWNIYRTDLTDKDEPSFFLATAFEEKDVLEKAVEVLLTDIDG